MRNLWFKQVYVGPILSGDKVDTVRLKAVPWLHVGDVVGASVGPRPRFATLRVTAIETIEIDTLDPERVKSIQKLYRLKVTEGVVLTRISFLRVEE